MQCEFTHPTKTFVRCIFRNLLRVHQNKMSYFFSNSKTSVDSFEIVVSQRLITYIYGGYPTFENPPCF